MKKFISKIVVVTIAVIFYGCFDTTEELTINANGSGTYVVKLDMSGLFSFMDMAKAMDTSAADSIPKLPAVYDTTIHFRSFTDTSSQLTKEEKALMHNVTMHMQMNEKEKLFKINMNYPFKQLTDINKIIELSGASGNIMGKALQGNMQNSDEPTNDMNEQAMPDFNSIYDFTYRNGLIEKKVNDAKRKEFEASEQYNNIKQAIDMFASSSMKTIIHLPKPAKKAEGEKVSLSADKKTITVDAALGDIFEDTNSLSYRIEY